MFEQLEQELEQGTLESRKEIVETEPHVEQQAPVEENFVIKELKENITETPASPRFGEQEPELTRDSLESVREAVEAEPRVEQQAPVEEKFMIKEFKEIITEIPASPTFEEQERELPKGTSESIGEGVEPEPRVEQQAPVEEKFPFEEHKEIFTETPASPMFEEQESELAEGTSESVRAALAPVEEKFSFEEHREIITEIPASPKPKEQEPELTKDSLESVREAVEAEPGVEQQAAVEENFVMEEHKEIITDCRPSAVSWTSEAVLLEPVTKAEEREARVFGKSKAEEQMVVDEDNKMITEIHRSPVFEKQEGEFVEGVLERAREAVKGEPPVQVPTALGAAGIPEEDDVILQQPVVSFVEQLENVVSEEVVVPDEEAVEEENSGSFLYEDLGDVPGLKEGDMSEERDSEPSPSSVCSSDVATSFRKIGEGNDVEGVLRTNLWKVSGVNFREERRGTAVEGLSESLLFDASAASDGKQFLSDISQKCEPPFELHGEKATDDLEEKLMDNVTSIVITGDGEFVETLPVDKPAASSLEDTLNNGTDESLKEKAKDGVEVVLEESTPSVLPVEADRNCEVVCSDADSSRKVTNEYNTVDVLESHALGSRSELEDMFIEPVSEQNDNITSTVILSTDNFENFEVRNNQLSSDVAEDVFDEYSTDYPEVVQESDSKLTKTEGDTILKQIDDDLTKKYEFDTTVVQNDGFRKLEDETPIFTKGVEELPERNVESMQKPFLPSETFGDDVKDKLKNETYTTIISQDSPFEQIDARQDDCTISSEKDDALIIADGSTGKDKSMDVATENFSEHLVKNLIKDVIRTMGGDKPELSSCELELTGPDEDISTVQKIAYEHETDYEADLKEKLEQLEKQNKDFLSMDFSGNSITADDDVTNTELRSLIDKSAAEIVNDVLHYATECLSQSSSTYKTATSKDDYDTCVTSQEDGFETADSWLSQESEYTTATSRNESAASEVSDDRRGSVTPLAALFPVDSAKYLTDAESDNDLLPLKPIPQIDFELSSENDKEDRVGLRTTASGVLLAPISDPGRPVSPVPPRPLDEDDNEEGNFHDDVFRSKHPSVFESLESKSTFNSKDSQEKDELPSAISDATVIKITSGDERPLFESSDKRPSAFLNDNEDINRFDDNESEKEVFVKELTDITIPVKKDVDTAEPKCQETQEINLAIEKTFTSDGGASEETAYDFIFSSSGPASPQNQNFEAVERLPEDFVSKSESVASISLDSLEKISDKSETGRKSNASEHSSSSRKSSYEEPENFTERLTPELKFEWSESTVKAGDSSAAEQLLFSPVEDYQHYYVEHEQVGDGELPTLAEESEEAESSNGRSVSSGHSSDHLGNRCKGASSDNVSETSLQEFERIERDVLNRGEAGLSSSELELYLSGKLKSSTNGSQNSLTEFERLEQEIGEGSPQEEVMILSDIREESEIEEMSIRDDDDEDEEHDSIAEVKSVPINDKKQMSTTPLASPTDSIERDYEKHNDQAVLRSSTDSLEIYDHSNHLNQPGQESDTLINAMESTSDFLKDSLEDIITEKPAAKSSVLETDKPQTSANVSAIESHQTDAEKDSLGGDLDSEYETYPTTVTTFETTQVNNEGYIETISRRVLTRVTDPVITHVQFTGTENEERVRQLASQEQYETSDLDGNVTKTVYIRREASPNEGNFF
uniref:Cardiomyopathy-associated protein 5 n=1 Tax=Syphacia muris TaxID=451379 RepID=A0A0N5AYZ9_9BILA